MDTSFTVDLCPLLPIIKMKCYRQYCLYIKDNGSLKEREVKEIFNMYCKVYCINNYAGGHDEKICIH